MATLAKLLILLVSPFAAVSTPVALTLPQKFIYDKTKEHNYFFRLPLFSSDNKNRADLLEKDRQRLEGYYRKYYQHPTYLNLISNFDSRQYEGSEQPNLFVQVKNKELLKNREWEWLKTVRLNQLSIDRWFERKSSDTDLISDDSLYQELIKTEHILPEYARLTRNTLSQDAIDLYFKTASISTGELRRLVYFPADDIGDKNWYVWWDKEIFRLKLNFGFQIWFFNQPFNRKYKFVKDYYSFKQSKYKALKEKLTSLYTALSEAEKEFFAFYYDEVWAKKDENKDPNLLVLKPLEFESKDLNATYNLLIKNSKSLEIFKGHLVQVLKGGDKVAFESFFPNYITYASGLDAIHNLQGGDGYKPDIKVIITPDRSLDINWAPDKLLDWIKYYSVQNFSLRTVNDGKNQWPSIIFDRNHSSTYPIIREHFLTYKVNT